MIMTNNTETIENIDALLKFLPEFSQTEKDFVTWKTVEPRSDGVSTLPYPEYASIVGEFGHLVSQEFWCDYHYDMAEVDAMFCDETSIPNASLAQIKSMLTYFVRGERFCDGLQNRMIREGLIAAILQRLQVLRDALPESGWVD
jgi:Family of unknown function (DUF6508)